MYVPSRARAGDSPTIIELMRDGIQPTVVVPMDERSDYAAAYPEALVMGVALHGIGMTRRWILRHARKQGHERMWMLDDDLDDPRTRAHFGAPYTFIPWNEWLGAIEDLTYSPHIGGATGMTRQYGWPEDSGIPNKRLGYAMLLRTDGPWDFWPFLHEDTDISLQILTQGYKTIKLPQYVFHTETMNKRGGGCQRDYDAGFGQVSGELLVRKWDQRFPGLVKLRENKAGATVTRVQWSRFRQGGTFA